MKKASLYLIIFLGFLAGPLFAFAQTVILTPSGNDSSFTGTNSGNSSTFTGTNSGNSSSFTGTNSGNATPPASTGGNYTQGTGGSYINTVALQNPLGGGVNNLGDLVSKVINFIASFLLAIAAFFIIWSGFKFVAAAGNPEKLSEAKESLKNALIGTVLILAASTIGLVVQSLITSLQSK